MGGILGASRQRAVDPPTLRSAIVVALGCALLAGGCGPGPYGYARTYQPLSEEEPFIDRAQLVSYEEVRRDPASHRQVLVGWFGVVRRVDLDPASGQARVSMSHRVHRERHLCQDETSGSCRVTVSDREIGPFTAVLQTRPEDREGEDRIWQGSLIKVYGAPTGDFDDDGGPVLQAELFRHWPAGHYVTTGSAGAMRR